VPNAEAHIDTVGGERFITVCKFPWQRKTTTKPLLITHKGKYVKNAPTKQISFAPQIRKLICVS